MGSLEFLYAHILKVQVNHYQREGERKQREVVGGNDEEIRKSEGAEARGGSEHQSVSALVRLIYSL